MTILEDLYYGNISPCERDIKYGLQMKKTVKRICKNEESFISTFTENKRKKHLISLETVSWNCME